MPFAADPELPKFKEDIGLIKPKLDKYYGVLVGNKFPQIDIKKLHQAVAGRVVYHEGLNALRLLYAPEQLLATNSASRN